MADSGWGGQKGWLWVLAALGVAVLLYLMFGLPGTGPGGGGGGGAGTPSAVGDRVLKQAGSDLEKYKAADYGAVYDALAASDQERATRDDWLARCKEVETAVGRIEEYRIGTPRYVDKQKTIIEVPLAIKWSKLKDKPQTTSTYYVIEGTAPRQTMLWGREFVVEPSEVK